MIDECRGALDARTMVGDTERRPLTTTAIGTQKHEHALYRRVPNREQGGDVSPIGQSGAVFGLGRFHHQLPGCYSNHSIGSLVRDGDLPQRRRAGWRWLVHDLLGHKQQIVVAGDWIADPEILAAMCLGIDNLSAQAGCGSVPPPSPPNGCGPVAGVYPPQGAFGANFTDACVRHDICYGTLGAPKEGCDSSFRTELVEACQMEYHSSIQLMQETQPAIYWVELTAGHYLTLGACSVVADGYAGAVSLGGSGRFASAQLAAECQSYRDAKSQLGCPQQ